MFWKKNRKIDQVAQELADEFFSQVQPNLAQSFFAAAEDGGASKSAGKKNKSSTGAVLSQLDRAVGRLRLVKEELKLGVYGKARFHMQFMSRLEDLGYPKDLAEQVNRHLMINIS